MALVFNERLPGEVQMSGGRRKNGANQKAEAGRDAYIAGGKQIIVNVSASYVPSAGEVNDNLPSFPEKPIIVGEIPREPIAFVERPELGLILAASAASESTTILVGQPGVGKTQIAGAVARKRLAEGWRLVAWVSAEEEASLLAGYRRLAKRIGVANDQIDAWDVALSVRNWLEADGDRCLVVLDNALSADLIRKVIPAAGMGQTIVTTFRRDLVGVGRAIEVDVFDQGQAYAYLASRTSRPHGSEAGHLADDLGNLPLALTQATALIVRQNISYAVYRERLKEVRLDEYLTRAEFDSYPLGMVEAVMLTMQAVESRDSNCCIILELLALLMDSGVPRSILYRAAERGLLPVRTALGVDAILQIISGYSLIGWDTEGGSVLLHSLVGRIIRERAMGERRWQVGAYLAIETMYEMIGIARDAGSRGDDVRIMPIIRNFSAVVERLTPHKDDLPDAMKEKFAQLEHVSNAVNYSYAAGKTCGEADFLMEAGRWDDAEEVLLSFMSMGDPPAIFLGKDLQTIRSEWDKCKSSLTEIKVGRGSELAEGIAKLEDVMGEYLNCLAELQDGRKYFLGELELQLSRIRKARERGILSKAPWRLAWL